MGKWKSTLGSLNLRLEKIFKNKTVLITGHTGFKGSWLAAILNTYGAKVIGLSLEPRDEKDHINYLDFPIKHYFADINHEQELQKHIEEINPYFIFHLAAQSLVKDSYSNPLNTWRTNVIGTLNLLNSSRKLSQLRGIIIATTDKCYQNNEWEWGYREVDRLGGDDPYSASKASTEIAISSFRKSFFSEQNSIPICTVRAGNVIGGGDWAQDRLIPDIFRSLMSQKELIVRFPDATRPWQHVLDCLYGYLLLSVSMLEKENFECGAFNIGPSIDANIKVEEILKFFQKKNKKFSYMVSSKKNDHEAQMLYLDSSKAYSKLGWKPKLSIYESLNLTSVWYEKFINKGSVQTIKQIQDFQKLL